MTKAAKRELQNLLALGLCAASFTIGMVWFFFTEEMPMGLVVMMLACAVLLRHPSE